MEEGYEQTHMAPEETRTPAPADPADPVRAFYESHPYPAPIGNLDRHRDLYETRIGAGHCPFCCGQRRRRGHIERS